MAVSNRNQMIVEGHEDLHAVVHLMKHHVQWGDEPKDWPVRIRIGRSVSEILDRNYINTIIKQSELRTRNCSRPLAHPFTRGAGSALLRG